MRILKVFWLQTRFQSTKTLLTRLQLFHIDMLIRMSQVTKKRRSQIPHWVTLSMHVLMYLVLLPSHLLQSTIGQTRASFLGYTQHSLVRLELMVKLLGEEIQSLHLSSLGSGKPSLELSCKMTSPSRRSVLVSCTMISISAEAKGSWLKTSLIIQRFTSKSWHGATPARSQS